MAARQPFLARRGGQPAPAPRPSPRPKPSRPNPRRKPGRPARPSPRRPATPAPRPAPRPGVPGPRPSGPLFPRPLRPSRPFAVPRPLVPGASPLARKTWNRLLRGLAPRLIPGFGWGLFAWDLYEAYQWWMQQSEGVDLASGGWFQCCGTGVGELNAYAIGPSSVLNRDPLSCSAITLCGSSGQVPDGAWPASLPALVKSGTSRYQGQYLYLGYFNANGTRMTFVEGYKRVVASPLYETPMTPHEWPETPGEVQRPYVPTELPYPYPYADPPPLVRPRPEPAPAAPPPPPPPPPPGGAPAIEWSPGGAPAPAIHVYRPPKGPEREKKKRLKPKMVPKWWDFLEGVGGSFMELDDYVSAIYKALPWKLRRWRGSDGVWRDRDANTKDRLERLFNHLGSLSVQDAIKNLVENEASDRAWGAVGNALKGRAKELGDEGLWAGLRGPGSSTPLNKDVWDAYKADQRARWRQMVQRGEYHNWYRVREYNPETNRWEYKLRQRPTVQIPWYRKQSLYPGKRALTGADGAYTVPRPRYYYAENRVPRPLIRRPNAQGGK